VDDAAQTDRKLLLAVEYRNESRVFSD